ncbi:amino acid adenylation domain-containing protein [Streptomyces sp. H27-D2]|uniref:amino acid adenylation domain-containing protein n=1 Tax=Streptomyces sp. H27-D2 TaxID=3046304 RepID=UPI002DBAB39B|nr:amino acid adenylation domain-containing protein [Streptomyces sp. H27-D2]MEC4018814.1 amino acid adenylation domain-containing protein [Streptomyces sp. H27-D2]
MNSTSGTRDRRFPLTASQTGMWFSQQLDPENPNYRAAEFVEFHSPVDLGLLQEALRRTVAETEAFQVRFEADDEGRVWQLVEPLPDWTLPVVELSGASDPLAAATEWMWSDLRRPCDLGRPPLFTFAVLRTAAESFLLYISAHHITLDGYGFSLFIQRVAALYSALEAGEECPPSPFGTLEQLLADEADYLRSERFARDRRYWAEQSSGRPAGSDLARRLTAVPHTFVRETGYVGPSAADGLRALARRARTGLPSAAMAALSLYVHRMSGRGEVTLDLTVTGRSGAVARRVPVMLANVLPLTVRLGPGTTVADLVRHTAQQARGLLRHQRYPSPQLVQDLGTIHGEGYLGDWGINIMGYDPRLSFGRHPAVLHNLSNGPVTGLGVNVYDRPADGSLRIDFNAGPALYSAEVTAAHHRRFLALLDTLATVDQDRPIGAVELLADAERHRVVSAWNDTARTVPATTLPELIQAQARRAPEATALVCGDMELSGAELNARANRLAHLLIAHGAGPETRVALALPRTADHLVALLAVLKSGAACVPLDRNHPAERIRFLLGDIRPLCVLTTAAGAPSLRSTAPALLLDGADTLRDLDRRPDTDPTDRDRTTPLLPGHPAYVSYTSGSTGRPKGVVVEHRQLTNLYFDHRSELIAPASAAADRPLRAALTATFSFDTAWEGPLFLAAGHELHLIEDSVRLDPAALVDHIAKREIDFLDLTPSYLHQLIAAGLLTGDRHRPRLLMVGGEALDAALWQTLRDCPGTIAYNYYGPTECTVDAVYCRLDEQGDQPVIGRPGRNVRAYVLDAALNPQPPAVPGELYLSGSQVARGYLDQPALTAERFIADPFGAPGARMYRTGDLARWAEPGVLEYLGRSDEQVKIRGFRIELGEIETTLDRHPGVAHTAVAVRESRPGERSLIAYVVPTARTTPKSVPAQRTPADALVDAAGLRIWATTRLPDYMVPAAFVILDALPLTANGKLDRTALPAPEPPADRADRPARSPQEETLCALFTEVLGVRSTSIDDDFFALGGHSLLAARLIGRIRHSLGTELSIGAIFEAPTVAALSRLLDTDTRRDAFGMLLPLRTGGSRPPLFCVHPAGGLSWCYAGMPRHLAADLPVYGLQARGLAGPGRLPATFEEMITDYLEHIRSVQPTGPYHLLGWSLGGALSHAIAVRLQSQGERVALLAMLDSGPIDPRARLRPPADQDVRALLLEAAGTAPERPDGAPTVTAAGAGAEATLSADGTTKPLPTWAEHSGLGDHHAAAVTAVLTNSVKLLPTVVEGVFDGDLLYFHATQGKPAHAPTSEAWRPLVTGRIESHDVACTHHAMTQPAALAQIGRTVSHHLDAVNTS